MFRPKKRKLFVEIPSASLADCAFLMLFFFLSTTKFDSKYGLGMVLPGPPDEETLQARINEDNLTRIRISPEGIITMNGDPVTLNELETRARNAVQQNSEMVFILRTDRHSRYVNMVDTLDRLRLAGARRINLSSN